MVFLCSYTACTRTSHPYQDTLSIPGHPIPPIPTRTLFPYQDSEDTLLPHWWSIKYRKVSQKESICQASYKSGAWSKVRVGSGGKWCHHSSHNYSKSSSLQIAICCRTLFTSSEKHPLWTTGLSTPIFARQIQVFTMMNSCFGQQSFPPSS